MNIYLKSKANSQVSLTINGIEQFDTGRRGMHVIAIDAYDGSKLSYETFDLKPASSSSKDTLIECERMATHLRTLVQKGKNSIVFVSSRTDPGNAIQNHQGLLDALIAIGGTSNVLASSSGKHYSLMGWSGSIDQKVAPSWVKESRTGSNSGLTWPIITVPFECPAISDSSFTYLNVGQVPKRISFIHLRLRENDIEPKDVKVCLSSGSCCDPINNQNSNNM